MRAKLEAAYRLFGRHKALIVSLQAVLIVFTYYSAFALRLDFSIDHRARNTLLLSLPWVICIKLLAFWWCGLLRGWWRYVGMSDLLDISKASVASAVFMTLAFWAGLWPRQGFPRSAILIDMVLTILVVGGARFLVRAYNEEISACVAKKETLIVGAGRAGSTIMRELKQNPGLDYKPIGFVDDDPTKMGIKIHGKRVLGTTDDISTLVIRHGVKCVLLAIPSANGSDIDRIISKCSQRPVEFKILKGVGNRIDGRTRVDEVRQVRVEDLLGREPVRLDLESIQKKLTGQSVLITGAGGSIGSELARQVAGFSPRELVLFERSENDLFHLCSELQRRFPTVRYSAVVGDILDVACLRDVFAIYRPDSVFHAAAYKHVPMMESNCFQAVTNNVFGTYNVALVAKQYRARDFVMISSDKAVNPANIMGVTKRVAELTILSLQKNETRFSAVRFGNVIGSNGSVLPIFEQQLRNGGPLTVTHPEIKRFFMTIPEAAQLVLQASSMGMGGEIFVLDMGEPVKIVDLAQKLIRISGLEAEKKIKIVFVGLRPGEKLSEELHFQAEGLRETSHPKIRLLDGGSVEFQSVREWLDELSALVEARNVSGLVAKLRTIVPEYSPSPEILAQCDVDRHDVSSKYRSARVALSQLDSSLEAAA
jgi:FlaA1/EpsC-like NDP-sugar epimerase